MQKIKSVLTGRRKATSKRRKNGSGKRLQHIVTDKMQVVLIQQQARGNRILISFWNGSRRRIHKSYSLVSSRSSSSQSVSRWIPVNEEHTFQNTSTLAEEVRTEEQHQNTIAQLLKPYYQAQTPIILRQAAIPQKAYRLWNDLKYLERQVGEDTPVDVEIGPSYSEGVVKSTIRFGDYLKYIQFINDEQHPPPSNTISTPSNYELVYMAQHELFPILAQDITVPYLCSYSTTNNTYEGVGHGKLYSSLFWFGPPGCKSTLHYDPCDNLLMQLVGRKKIILHPPQPEICLGWRERHYKNNDNARNDWYYSGPKYGQQYNTSSVDVECPDFIKYPLYRQALPGHVSILLPGDILFIPKQWWHFLRALDTSISVNVWWR